MDMRKKALVLVDVQEDFLQRSGLVPSRDEFLGQLTSLLRDARALGWPVIHVQTVVSVDGSDAMPHWRHRDPVLCRQGQAGTLPPQAVQPLPGESVVQKRFFSPFWQTCLADVLHEQGVQTLVLVGLYTHACIRAAVLDAYQRGFECVVVDDAVASTEPLHAELTRAWLKQRACRFMPWDVVRGGAQASAHAHGDVERAVAAARMAWDPDAPTEPCLLRWRGLLQAQQEALAEAVVSEIHKPIRDAREEVRRMLAHLATALGLSAQREQAVAPGVRVRYRPLGCVALITPWNNPLAIAVGKLAPALALGNAVVWKPAPECIKTSMLLMDTLMQAGCPPGLVSLVQGDGRVGEALMRHPGVDAVSLTGSMRTGAQAAAVCALSGKPLQAELGGNNAAIVWPGADLDRVAHDMSLAALSFSGQRCTAVRRIIVHQSLMSAFSEKLVAAVRSLPDGDLRDEATVLSPLVGRHRVDKMVAVMALARQQGATVLCGGSPGEGARFLPTVVLAPPDAEVFLEESFGPVVVLTPARDLTHALTLNNAVPHGLMASLCGGDRQDQARFLRDAQAGMLRLGSVAWLHPEAPFVGWKGSALGPPEHGRWDLEFYARPQTVYDVPP